LFGRTVSKSPRKASFWQSIPFLQGAFRLAVLFLLIEFFDEFHYGIQTAALPAMRADLSLSYAQVGALLGVPGVFNALIEPVLMLLGDTRWRKGLVVSGGLAICLAALMLAGAQSFPMALLAFGIAFTASGAFVTLSQATLMNQNPGRQEQMMARWTAAGSLGNLIGPLLLAGGFALGWGWRWAYVGLAVVVLLLVIGVLLAHFPGEHAGENREKIPAMVCEACETAGSGATQIDEVIRKPVEPLRLQELLPNLWLAVQQPGLMRWFGLLEMSDLLLDVYTSYLALYLADVVGLSKVQVGLALSALMLVSLAMDLLLIPLLERVDGLKVVRIAAGCACLVYPAMLLAPWPGVKVALALLVRCTTLGWYPVLQGQAYASLPGRSGTVMAIHAVISVISMSLVWLVGWTAAQAGLPAAMWLLLSGPAALVAFIPKTVRSSDSQTAN
jgi:FSR family fosmidomycin resistance protein-like MFS transporter